MLLLSGNARSDQCEPAVGNHEPAGPRADGSEQTGLRPRHPHLRAGAASRSNSAARRIGSRWAATSSSSRTGGAPARRRPARHGPARGRSAAPSARRSSSARPASPWPRWVTARSARCGPTSARPAAASAAARAQRGAQGRPARSPSSARPARGERRRRAYPPAARPAPPPSRPRRRPPPRHARPSGLQRVEPGRIGRALGEQFVARPHRRFVARGVAGMAGLAAPAPAGRGSGGGRRRFR